MPTDGASDVPRAADEAAPAFEAAQRTLFEAVGLDVRSRFVDLDAPRSRVHVIEAGPPGDGPPLVFVHGTASFGAFLAPLMARFDDVRTIAFDRPGYGLSSAFTYTERNLQRAVVDALEGILDATDTRQVDLVGHSMGGHACVLYALAHSDRVRRLFLFGAVPAFPGTRPPFPLRLLTVPLLDRVVRRLQKSGEEGALDAAERFGEREAVRDRPALVRAMAANGDDPKSAAAGVSEFDALFSIRGWHPSVRIREGQLRDLRHPTTLVWGERDPLGEPDDVRDAVEAIPNARLEVLDAGHVPFLAHPQRCARIVREARAEATNRSR